MSREKYPERLLKGGMKNKEKGETFFTLYFCLSFLICKTGVQRVPSSESHGKIQRRSGGKRYVMCWLPSRVPLLMFWEHFINVGKLKYAGLVPGESGLKTSC